MRTLIKKINLPSRIKNRIRYDYNFKPDETPMTCCESIMQLSGFSIEEIMLTMEDKLGHTIMETISTLEELKKYKVTKEIASCQFMGKYNEVDVDIVVDFWLKKLNIVATDEALIETLNQRI